jgi:serine protease Do
MMMWNLWCYIGIGFFLCTNFSFARDLNIKDKRSSTEKNTNTDDNNHLFARIAQKVLPSVVSIRSTIVVRANDLWKKQLDDPDLRNFLGENYDKLAVPKEFRQKGSGSGIIVSKEGHILTNVHVIENAEDIDVKLYDKTTYKAEVVGIDPLTEIAVIKIAERDLPPASLGDSDSCEIGEWVLAIGNPLELSFTVTAGIISAKGRDINIIPDTYGVENFIQTDAAINPGNSGGALVNLKGEVIGLNTAIASDNGFNQGYGFAIPINLAKYIMDDLIHEGHVTRGYLGVSMQDMDEKKARALGLKKPIGVFIDAVLEDGPALRAGLKEKDVLTKIDNTPVNDANIVQSIIAKKNPKEVTVLSIIRKGKKLDLHLNLGERQYTTKVKTSNRQFKSYPFLGLELADIPPKIATELGLNNNQGVLITAVERFSPAYDSGLQVDDIILQIGDESLTSKNKFQAMLVNFHFMDVIILKIQRKNTAFHVFVEIPEP